MKKILIISYYFPPCNLTAAHRAYSFARFLSEMGHETRVLTRDWSHPIRTTADVAVPSGKEIRTTESEGFETTILPYCGTTRDRFYSKYPSGEHSFFRRLLTFVETLLLTLSVFHRSKQIFHKEARRIIKKEEIDVLIISANPFWQFYYGYLLKKEFPKLKWIADYRDDWTTGKMSRNTSILHQFFHQRERRKEKKWVKPADLIISVTDELTNRISDFVKVPSETIANGYMEIPDQYGHVINKKLFIISYTGYVYQDQKIEIFLDGFIKAARKYDEKIHLQMRFIGSALEPETNSRIRQLMQGFEQNFELTSRLSAKECLKMEADSDALLSVGFIGQKGIPGSKLYQYLSHKKPIILCPSDDDIIQEILDETGLGLRCDNSEEVFKCLCDLIEKKLTDKELISNYNEKAILKYSRKKQVEKLSGIIESFN